MGQYLSACGRLPVSTDSVYYICDWWQCAYTTAEGFGICSDYWYTFFTGVRNHIMAEEGVMPWILQQRINQDDNYIRIWMSSAPEVYLGRFKWACAPFGDITKVTLDNKLLPEGGTLPWLLNDDAHVKVFFKNTGNVASAFHIWVTDETGTTITGCDITTAEIPADGAEYFVDLCVLLPDVVKVKTLTAHIEP